MTGIKIRAVGMEYPRRSWEEKGEGPGVNRTDSFGFTIVYSKFFSSVPVITLSLEFNQPP